MRHTILLLLATALSGCSVVQGMLPGGAQTVSFPAQSEAPRTDSGPKFSTTPIVQGPLLNVTLLERGTQAALEQSGTNGSVTTWVSSDGISVSLDRGVLVATRGLGDDLMAASARPTLDALAGKPDEYRREYRFLSAENHPAYQLMGCTMEPHGSETLTGKRLMRYDETCRTFSEQHINSYWTDGSGEIVVSRQWISPLIGALTTAWE